VEDKSSGATVTPLRRRLLVLTAAGVLPLAVIAGVELYVLAARQRAEARRVGIELARSVATAVDAQLSSSGAVLEALSTAITLDSGDLSGFRERARRVLELQPGWAAIRLADPSGKPLLDTRVAQEAPLPSMVEPESFAAVVRTRRPAVGNLVRDAHAGWLFPVRAPVVRGGELKYVLTGLVKPDEIRGLLTRQRVPGDWIVSIVDANGLRVARSRAHDDNLGGRLSPSVQSVVDAGGAEGFGIAHALEGERIYTPYSRLVTCGWIAVLGIPASPAESVLNRSLAILVGSVLLSLALGALAALSVARSINQPMAELRAAAQALGRRQTTTTTQSSIQEIRDVAAALSAASQELAKGEEERDELLRKERVARERAEAADRAKEEFLAVLSHELRTPLNAVFGWSRMLQSGEIDDEATAKRAIDAIVRNADVQVQLIDDLLDLSRITSGKMHLEIGPVAMEKVLQGALDAVRPAAEAKGIEIETDVNELAGTVRGDPSRLQQVVWNVLINAVKFTPKGGQVRLRMYRADSRCNIVVSDTGEGISPEVLPHVFERFRQADSSSTRTHGGLGLGLALVKHLVELHGGTVLAQSAGIGRGATFVVSLPVAAVELPDDRSDRSPGAQPANAGVARLDGVRVLVVDDDADAVRLAETILTGAGAQVRSCHRAADGLELIKTWRPDVMVSDIEMPGEDGFSLIRKVRTLASGEGGDTPAVALTAYGRMQDRHRSLAAGYSMHVPKPVDPGELTSIVAGLAGQLGVARRS
jgi:signal transduction histidine kinase/ActR/RegA family two-component response regulator